MPPQIRARVLFRLVGPECGGDGFAMERRAAVKYEIGKQRQRFWWSDEGPRLRVPFEPRRTEEANEQSASRFTHLCDFAPVRTISWRRR
jgi:hypothetical protein